jgi:hypothetical protein
MENKIIKNEKEIDRDPYLEEPPKRKSIFKKIFKGVGYGGFFVGSGIIGILYFILNFLLIASVGLGMIGIAIRMFMEGSILWGILVLLGTPLAIGLASYLFFFFMILGVFSLILWGIATILGFDISFWTAKDIVWLIGKIIILGIMAGLGIMGLTEAIKEKNILGFFKDFWWGILFFCFLFWLFFI